MNALVIAAVILTIGLISAGGIYAAGSTFRSLARTLGVRRTKAIAGGLVCCLVFAGMCGVWYFATMAKQRAASVKESSAEVTERAVVAGKQAGDLNVLVARLEERLRSEPGDAQGLALYARTLSELARYKDAAAAYENAVRVLPDDAALRLEMADAAYMAGGQKWTETATSALKEGLRLAPEHPEALWLAGKERFESRDFENAVRHWETLARVASPDSDYAREMRSALPEARTLRDGKDPAAAAKAGAGGPPVSPLPASPAARSVQTGLVAELQSTLATMNGKGASSTAGRPRASIFGTVKLDPVLKNGVSPEDIVFIYAHHADRAQGALPLAMLRQRIADLPLRFELSDNNAMSPDHKLSSAEKVIVVARVSKSGDAAPRNGDLEGVSPPVAPFGGNLDIAINRRR